MAREVITNVVELQDISKTSSKTLRFSNYEAPKYTTRKLKSVERLRNIFRVFKQHYMDFCDPNSSMLGAELAYDPKIKVVALLK